MKITRLVELSLFYKLKEKFSTRKTKEKPKALDLSTYNLKYPSIQYSESVVVYVDGVEITTGYTVDYENGIIKFLSPLTALNVVEVDYSYCSVNVYDEGSTPSNTDDFKYPAIALYEDDSDFEAIELGSNKKEIHATWIIEVAAEHGGQRNDIKDTIIEFFEEELAIIDYNIAFPTVRGGEINPAFNYDAQIAGYAVCDSINSTNGGSLDIGDKPKFLCEIVVELVVSI